MSIYMQTQRLILRQVTQDDKEAIVRYAGDLEVADMMNGAIPYPYGIEDARAWIDKHQNDTAQSKAISWAIVEKIKGTLIGSIQLRKAEDNEAARLSYWIGKDYWRQGYATEAVKAVVEFAFKKLGLKCLEAEHFERNSYSGAVLKKNGFVLVEWSDRKEGLKGREERFLLYQLLLSSSLGQSNETTI